MCICEVLSKFDHRCIFRLKRRRKNMASPVNERFNSIANIQQKKEKKSIANIKETKVRCECMKV